MAKKKTTKRKKPKRLPKIALMAVCDAVSRDPNTGKISLYGLYDLIWARKFPATHPSLSVLVRLRGGNGQHGISVAILDPNGKPVSGHTPEPIQVNLSENSRVELVIQFVGLELKKAGTYKIVVCSGNRQIGDALDLRVKRRPTQK